MEFVNFKFLNLGYHQSVLFVVYTFIIIKISSQKAATSQNAEII